jgi:hypothetical protein
MHEKGATTTSMRCRDESILLSDTAQLLRDETKLITKYSHSLQESKQSLFHDNGMK